MLTWRNVQTNYAQPDVMLGLDLGGIIERAVLANAIANEVTTDWVGQRWADTVTGGTDQVQRMLEDAKATGVSPFSELVQRFPSGRELRVEYTTVRLGGGAGLIAIGRSLEAVSGLRSRLIEGRETMERDFWKLRDVATRYRLQFDLSPQPLILIDDELELLEANPIALQVIGQAGIIDLDLAQRSLLRSTLARVREQGRAPGVLIRFSDNQTWLVRASIVSVEGVPAYLLQLAPAQCLDQGIASLQNPSDREAMRKAIEDQVAAVERRCVTSATRELARKHHASVRAAGASDDDEPSGSA